LRSSEPRGEAAAAKHAARVGDVLFPVVLLTVAFGTRPRITGGDMSLDHWTDVAGALVSLTGQTFRVLVIGLVYITRGGQNRQVWADALVDRGMFAHSRNPLYVANLLLFLGLAIVHNGWAMYLIVLPFFVVAYVCIVAAEEAFLVERFGAAYAEYRRRVPRWMPSLRGVRLAEGLAQGIRDAVRLDQRSAAAARVGARRWRVRAADRPARARIHHCDLDHDRDRVSDRADAQVERPPRRDIINTECT
jgi:protein-S-isoprenylcysteine O-methyltransferase Ste14